jgi:hypothetical protein
MADEVPDLRRHGFLYRLAEALLSRLHRREHACPGHCHCVSVLKAKVAIMMAVFVFVVAHAVWQIVAAQSAVHVDAAPPPYRPGERMGADRISP